MGFLDIFRKKNQPVERVSPLDQEISAIKNWMNYLHLRTEELRNHSHFLADSHKEHRRDVLEYSKNLNEWIAYLHAKNHALEQAILRIEENIKIAVKEDMKKYHTEIIGHIKDTRILKENDTEDLKAEIMVAVSGLMQQRNESIVPSNSIRENTYNGQDFSPSEKHLINILFNENNPLTYEDLARKTGKSINSIRVYMNSIKLKRDIVDEFRKPTGEKIFSIKNKEKVNTLFNISSVL